MKRYPAILLVLMACLAAGLVGCGGSSHTKTVVIKTTTSTATATVTSTTTAVPGGQPLGPGNRPPNFGRTPPGFKLLPPLKNPGPTVEQFDSADVSTIPVSAKYIAGYVGGSWPTFFQLSKSRFPQQIHKISIAVNSGERAECLDIEPGDANTWDAGSWVVADRAAGFKKPCIYAPLTLWADIRANLAAHGIARSSIEEWDAHWTEVPHIDTGFDATQWTETSEGRKLDESTAKFSFVGLTKSFSYHYNWLPTTRRRFKVGTKRHHHVIHTRERQAIHNWDKEKCKNPVHRHECQVWRTHMILLDARLVHLALHTPNGKHHVKHPRWSARHYKASDGHLTTLGGAIQQFKRRESMKHHGRVKSWSNQ